MGQTENGPIHMNNPGGAHIKAWTRGVPIEDEARQQLFNVANLPFIHSHIAVMPDVHWGKGATVGSVIATKGAIVPAAVGVDIGCGMMAVRTSIRAEHLPDSLLDIRIAIEAAVPHGRTDNGGRNDKGAWQGDVPQAAIDAWGNGLAEGYDAIVAKHPKIAHGRGIGHLGTWAHSGLATTLLRFAWMRQGKCGLCYTLARAVLAIRLALTSLRKHGPKHASGS
jgi:tRNA-splicing ligase RtcB (3'-phosphate/5'-hydroxy nucleic acid ligase)